MLADFVCPHVLMDVVNSIEWMVRVTKIHLSGFSSMCGNTDLDKKPNNPGPGGALRPYVGVGFSQGGQLLTRQSGYHFFVGGGGGIEGGTRTKFSSNFRK